MANPPPPAPKKKGLGCCGCGCLILALIVLLVFGLFGGLCYVGYSGVMKITEAAPAAVPTFDGGDDVYNRAQQKMQGFNHDVQNHLAATIHLTADELNTLIARNPDFANNKILVFVTFTDDQARVQSSFPTDLLPVGSLVKGRYLNADYTFNLNFAPDTKTISLDLKDIKLGPTEISEEKLPSIQKIIDFSLNYSLQKNPAAKDFLDHTTAMEIKNSELVIETK